MFIASEEKRERFGIESKIIIQKNCEVPHEANTHVALIMFIFFNSLSYEYVSHDTDLLQNEYKMLVLWKYH